MEKKIVLVRNSVSGKGLELAESLLEKNVAVMINGEKQIDIVVAMNRLAHKYPAGLIYGAPGNIMSVEEFSRFYAPMHIAQVVSA